MTNRSTPNVVRLEAVQVAPIWNGCGEAVLVHEAIPIKQRARQTLTAVRTLAETLRLYSWRVNADGGVHCTGTTTAEVNDVVQIALVRAQKYVTACRTPNFIQLQSWDVSNTGAIYGLVPAAMIEGHFSWFTLIALSLTQLVTIALTQAGAWQLMAWQLDEEGILHGRDTVTLQTATTGALAALPLPATAAGNEFAVVSHCQADRLCWCHWRCTPDGQFALLNRLEQPFTDVIDVALTRQGDELFTLIQTAQGQLSLLRGMGLVQQVPSYTGLTSYPIASDVAHFAVAGEAEQLLIAYSGIAYPSTTVATAQTADHTPEPSAHHRESVAVHLERWQPTLQGWQPCAAGALPLSTATGLQICDETLDGHAPYLIAIGTADGALHLTTWRQLAN